MNPRLALLLGTLLATSQVSAQTTNSNRGPSAKVAAAASARAEAVNAIKSGNATAAAAKLRAAARRGPSAPSDDLQVVCELCAIARELEGSQPGSGRAAALAAVEEGSRAKGRLTNREVAALHAQLGELHEFLIGDPRQARTHYQNALTADPTRLSAQRGLDRLQHLESVVAARTRENASLLRRAPR